MGKRGRKVKNYKELNEELSLLLNEEKEATEKEKTIKTNLDRVDLDIENLKRDIIDLKTKKTITVAELDGQIKHKKNELLKIQKLRRSIVYENGRILEKHRSIQRSITRRKKEIDEMKSKFMEKMEGNNQKSIPPPSNLEGLGALEIKDNGDGN